MCYYNREQRALAGASHQFARAVVYKDQQHAEIDTILKPVVVRAVVLDQLVAKARVEERLVVLARGPHPSCDRSLANESDYTGQLGASRT